MEQETPEEILVLVARTHPGQLVADATVKNLVIEAKARIGIETIYPEGDDHPEVDADVLRDEIAERKGGARGVSRLLYVRWSARAG